MDTVLLNPLVFMRQTQQVQLKLYVSLRDVLDVAWLAEGYTVAVVVLCFHPALENQTVAVWALA